MNPHADTSASGHAHGHGHSHGREKSRRALAISLGMTVAYGLGQLVAGVAFHSLALIADAAHNVSDGGSILLALVAAWAAGLPVHGARTFGWRRIEVIAALVNGLLLILLGMGILYEGATRVFHPEHVHGLGVAIVGLIGVAANGIPVLLMLRASRGQNDINLRGALIHAATDVLGSAGALLAGLLIVAFSWYRADPIIAIGIGLIVMWSSWSLLRDSMRILLEIAPKGCEPDVIGSRLANIDGVAEVHDLHIWTITSDFPALSAHIITNPDVPAKDVLLAARTLLKDEFQITHVTLQIDQATPDFIELSGTLIRPHNPPPQPE